MTWGVKCTQKKRKFFSSVALGKVESLVVEIFDFEISTARDQRAPESHERKESLCFFHLGIFILKFKKFQPPIEPSSVLSTEEVFL